MSVAFDHLADDYAALLHDPIREKFAPGSRFFHERKLLLLREFFQRRGQDTHALRWLDAGCGQGELLRLGRPHFADVCGCDPSASMLDRAADLPVRLQTAVACLPYADEAFDLV